MTTPGTPREPQEVRILSELTVSQLREQELSDRQANALCDSHELLRQQRDEWEQAAAAACRAYDDAIFDLKSRADAAEAQIAAVRKWAESELTKLLPSPGYREMLRDVLARLSPPASGQE